jgi:hypothetical protein
MNRDFAAWAERVDDRLDVTRSTTSALDRVDRGYDSARALVPHDQDQRRMEMVGRELDAPEYNTLVQHLGAGPGHCQVTKPAIEYELRRHPRIDAREHGCKRMLRVTERLAARDRLGTASGSLA